MKIKLDKAIKLATKYHEWQFRKDGTPYIVHPIAVMDLLKKYNFPEDALISAVLHDICEDTKLSILDINDQFWTRVWFIINALSKNKKPKNNKELKKDFENKQNKKKISNLESYTNYGEYMDFRFHLYLNRFYMWIIAEPWIFYIKIADQMHNLWTMWPFPTEKKKRKIEELEKYFMPIYEKVEEIFNINVKSSKEYHVFMNLIKISIEKAKSKI